MKKTFEKISCHSPFKPNGFVTKIFSFFVICEKWKFFHKNTVYLILFRSGPSSSSSVSRR